MVKEITPGYYKLQEGEYFVSDSSSGEVTVNRSCDVRVEYYDGIDLMKIQTSLHNLLQVTGLDFIAVVSRRQ